MILFTFNLPFESKLLTTVTAEKAKNKSWFLCEKGINSEFENH